MMDQAQQEKDEAEREAAETRRLMELDADEEIEGLKARHDMSPESTFWRIQQPMASDNQSEDRFRCNIG